MTSASWLFELLSNDHRRRILFLLCGSDSIDVPEGLCTRGAAQTQHAGDSRPAPSPTRAASTDPTVGRLETELRHNHLPKLESEGVIEWDRDADTVAKGPVFQEIEPALRFLASNPVVFPGDLL
jgi:hypothetical protein